MKLPGRGLSTLLVVTSLMGAGGCESGSQPAASGPAGQTEATVTGKVTVKGKTAVKGKVTFEPEGPNGMPIGERIGEVRKDGTYEVKTLTGQNGVTVSGTGNPAADTGGYNRINFEVKAGSNTKDLDLPLNP